MRKNIFLVLLVAMLNSCVIVNVGQDFMLTNIDNKITIGKTSQQNIRQLIGEPQSAGRSYNSKGEVLTEWLYFHASGTLPSMNDTALKMLQIRFDSNGIVSDYNWSGK